MIRELTFRNGRRRAFSETQSGSGLCEETAQEMVKKGDSKWGLFCLREKQTDGRIALTGHSEEGVRSTPSSCFLVKFM